MKYSILAACLCLSSCDLPEATKATKTEATKEKVPPSFNVKLLGPGDRGNFFLLQSDNFSPGGKCFDGSVNGVKGFGKLILPEGKPYNLHVYFISRHSSKSDRDKIRAVTVGKTIPVNINISKCSNGYYDRKKHIANFTNKVEVGF